MATTQNLISTYSDHVTWKVDNSTVLPDAQYQLRNSVRLLSNANYTHALFVLDVNHMPYGCGLWPAFWSLGAETPWPWYGEIDILEGFNSATGNTVSLHTNGTDCKIAGSGAVSTSTLNSNLCTVYGAGYSNYVGCTFSDGDTQSYGAGLNSEGGGVYAMEWTSNWIRVWFFNRQNIPTSITNGAPNVTTFGTPRANFQFITDGTDNCTIDQLFSQHQIVFDTTLCGSAAGPNYGSSNGARDSCPMSDTSNPGASCANYVLTNPSGMDQGYWSVNSLKVYQQLSAGASSTAVISTTLSTVQPVGGTSGLPVAQGNTSVITTTTSSSSAYGTDSSAGYGSSNYNYSPANSGASSATGSSTSIATTSSSSSTSTSTSSTGMSTPSTSTSTSTTTISSTSTMSASATRTAYTGTSTPLANIECPDYNNSTFMYDDLNWLLLCDSDMPAAEQVTNQTMTFGECVAICASYASCFSATYSPTNMFCYTKSNINGNQQPFAAVGYWNARLYSGTIAATYRPTITSPSQSPPTSSSAASSSTSSATSGGTTTSLPDLGSSSSTQSSSSTSSTPTTATSSTTQSVAPLPISSTTPDCNTIFVDSSNTTFHIYCNATVSGNTLSSSQAATVTTFPGCISLCGSYNGTCSAAVFYNTTTPSCELKTNAGSSSSKHKRHDHERHKRQAASNGGAVSYEGNVLVAYYLADPAVDTGPPAPTSYYGAPAATAPTISSTSALFSSSSTTSSMSSASSVGTAISTTSGTLTIISTTSKYTALSITDLNLTMSSKHSHHHYDTRSRWCPIRHHNFKCYRPQWLYSLSMLHMWRDTHCSLQQ